MPKKKRRWAPSHQDGRPARSRLSFLSNVTDPKQLKPGQRRFMTILRRGWAACQNGIPADECPWPAGGPVGTEACRRAWLEGWGRCNSVIGQKRTAAKLGLAEVLGTSP